PRHPWWPANGRACAGLSDGGKPSPCVFVKPRACGSGGPKPLGTNPVWPPTGPPPRAEPTLKMTGRLSTAIRQRVGIGFMVQLPRRDSGIVVQRIIRGRCPFPNLWQVAQRAPPLLSTSHRRQLLQQGVTIPRPPAAELLPDWSKDRCKLHPYCRLGASPGSD